MAQHDPLATALHSAIASEVRHIRTLLEQLAEVLVGDTYFATLYLDQLQHFDFLVQCADENAAVLDRLADGAAAHDAIAPVRLGLVQDRLRAALTLAETDALARAA